MNTKYFYKSEEVKTLTEKNKELEDRILELSQKCDALEEENKELKSEYKMLNGTYLDICRENQRLSEEKDFYENLSYCYKDVSGMVDKLMNSDGIKRANQLWEEKINRLMSGEKNERK